MVFAQDTTVRISGEDTVDMVASAFQIPLICGRLLDMIDDEDGGRGLGDFELEA
jgi:hypothetical protein